MSKRHRTTRTATLVDGPLAGTTLQLRIGDTTVTLATGDDRREVYAGSPLQHDGFIELRHLGTTDAAGNLVAESSAA